jgi:[acyl-carrier-protein] S-malonyltransferase
MSVQYPDFATSAFLFPGVGAQQSDMFAAFRQFPAYRACLQEVSDLSDLNLDDIIHGAERDVLRQVRVAQLALTATTVAIARILREECGLLPEFVMGHSLGQYPALCAGGYLDLATVTRIVNLRSEAVESCARQYQQGEMCWILHLPADSVAQQVEVAREQDGIRIWLSAVDAFDQATISGEMAEIRRFAPRIEALGGLVYPLKIGGPFHSPLMAQARSQLDAGLTFLPAPDASRQLARLVCNVSGAELDSTGLHNAILDHLVSPVQWLRSMQYLAAQGVTRYLEISPKSVLAYLVDRAELPMRPLCAPQALANEVDALATAEQRRTRFYQQCCQHVYSTPLPRPLPALAPAAASQQLYTLRAELHRQLASQPANAAERELLYANTRQWLDQIEAGSGQSRALERQRLRSLYQSAER